MAMHTQLLMEGCLKGYEPDNDGLLSLMLITFQCILLLGPHTSTNNAGVPASHWCGRHPPGGMKHPPQQK